MSAYLFLFPSALGKKLLLCPFHSFLTPPSFCPGLGPPLPLALPASGYLYTGLVSPHWGGSPKGAGGMK